LVQELEEVGGVEELEKEISRRIRSGSWPWHTHISTTVVWNIWVCRERETVQLMNQSIPFLFSYTPIHIIAEHV